MTVLTTLTREQCLEVQAAFRLIKGSDVSLLDHVSFAADRLELLSGAKPRDSAVDE